MNKGYNMKRKADSYLSFPCFWRNIATLNQFLKILWFYLDAPPITGSAHYGPWPVLEN